VTTGRVLDSARLLVPSHNQPLTNRNLQPAKVGLPGSNILSLYVCACK
jgi:hypothetical protein